MGAVSSASRSSSSYLGSEQPCRETTELPSQDESEKTIFDGVNLPPEEPYQTVDEIVCSRKLIPGDPIEIEDSVLRHWALYAGEGKGENGEKIPMVIHLFSVNGKPHEVRYDPLFVAVGQKRCRVNFKYDHVLKAKTPDEIMKTAHGKLGTKDYHILNYNCEHFVTGCRYGFFVSEQVQEARSSFTKQLEIVKAVVSNGFSTATYTLKGLLPFQK